MLSILIMFLINKPSFSKETKSNNIGNLTKYDIKKAHYKASRQINRNIENIKERFNKRYKEQLEALRKQINMLKEQIENKDKKD